MTTASPKGVRPWLEPLAPPLPNQSDQSTIGAQLWPDRETFCKDDGQRLILSKLAKHCQLRLCGPSEDSSSF